MPKLSDGKEFDKPLNQFIEEEVEVDVVRPLIDENNPEHKTFVRRKEKFTQKTMYLDIKPKQIMCPEGEHDFVPTLVPNRFACEKCKFNVVAYPHKARYNPQTKKLEPRGWK